MQDAHDIDLRLVADEIRACTACPLHRSARQAVPGDGSADSGIFFLGEAPGYHDGLLIFPVYHPAAALHQPALRDALHADFAALALFLATTPPTKEPEEKPVEQITLFG